MIPSWVYEPKWDGFRVIAMMRGGSVQLLSRNLHPFTALFRPITEALKGFPTTLVLDGEAVILDKQGHPDFEALQGWLRPQARSGGRLAYMVFDCLYANGHSLLSRPLEERRKILRELTPALQAQEVRVSESFPGDQGTLVFKTAVGMGLEGVIAKRRQSVYRPGMRSRDWVKIPVRQRDEFVVGGYLAPSPDHLSTLIVGQYDRAGTLRYAGLVGTGLSQETRRELQATERKTCPFVPVPRLRDHFGELRTDVPPRWVRPGLVVEVEYRQRTSDGLRHAALKGIRPDKKPGGVRTR